MFLYAFFVQEKKADLVHNKAMYESQVISNVLFGNYCLRFLNKKLLHNMWIIFFFIPKLDCHGGLCF